MKSDIPALAAHLLNNMTGGPAELGGDVLEMLCNYAWPGNIRELKNVLERALLLAQGEHLRPAHFPGLRLREGAPQIPTSTLNLREIEQAKIRAALDQYDGNVDRAAKALGLSRATMYRRLKSLRIKAAD